MTAPTLEGFRSVRGHAAAVALLRRAFAFDRLAGAYLFAGPLGVGKDRVAHCLAQLANCRARTTDQDACGQCPSCRKIALGQHPDVKVLQRDLKDPPRDPERLAEHARRRLEDVPEGELRPAITVDQVRELVAPMAFRPHEGGTRWVVVREAERLREEAANAFLKTLEEPPPATHFVLLTHSPSRLLTTIRSRCQVVRFGALDTEDVVAVLESLGHEGAAARSLAELADGSVGRALEYSDAEALKVRREWVGKLLGSLQAARPGAFVELADKARALDKRDLDAVLTLFQRHFRAEALAQAAGHPRASAVHAARADVVRGAQESLTFGPNLNVQMVLEDMLVRLREARP
ncbi:MAG: DNA polymerase III subunit delta' [Deltaproteobacteria bacterium]|nr:DNA polymerase III subunit delta' [Deltaproteobacteria bacterium]